MVAALLALFALRYQVNQVVLGVVLVAFASGLTSFLLNQIPDRQKECSTSPDPRRDPRSRGWPTSRSSGEALFNQTILVYLMYFSIVP